jgi:hypothetical protein
MGRAALALGQPVAMTVYVPDRHSSSILQPGAAHGPSSQQSTAAAAVFCSHQVVKLDYGMGRLLRFGLV